MVKAMAKGLKGVFILSLRRLYLLMSFFLLLYMILVLRIAYFQVIKGQDLAAQATAMRSQGIRLSEYSRGEILDRNYQPLTGSYTSTALYGLPAGMRSNRSVSDKVYGRDTLQVTGEILGQILDKQDSKAIQEQLRLAAKNGTTFVRIASDLSEAEVQRVISHNLPGITVAPLIKRYRQDGFCCHVLGYVGGYQNNEGQAGIEKRYNALLQKGSSPQELLSVYDARGALIKGLNFKFYEEEDRARGSVVLTIDKRIQEIVEEEISAQVKSGAVVVMDVDSREVLAMASRPSFNPYHIEYLLKHDQNSSLINRALSRYHPGSLFKILVTTAALEENLVSERDKFHCSGKYVFNETQSTSCWKEEGHGELSFAQAFACSCNPSFIEVGQRLGREKLLTYVDKLHLCDETLLGYAYHPGSYVRINPGKIALSNACLGQEGVMLSPLQISSLLATVADDGLWQAPSLLRYTINSKGERSRIASSRKERVISPETAGKVQELMELVVSEGTGKNAALAEIKVAGKTASSETGNWKEDGEQSLDTWFGGYFPADNPRWVVLVLVQEGESGAVDAAPVFKNIAREMLKIL